jgi:hypothetical protein
MADEEENEQAEVWLVVVTTVGGAVQRMAASRTSGSRNGGREVGRLGRRGRMDDTGEDKRVAVAGGPRRSKRNWNSSIEGARSAARVTT